MKTFPLAIVLLVLATLSQVSYSQWSTSSMINNQVTFLSGEQTDCYVATHPNGHTYISWFSSEAGGMYFPRVQLFDIEGNQLWADEGILVSNHTSMTWITDYDMDVSPDGGCIIAFQDIRTGNNDAFIYKISPDGDFLWGDDGIQLSNDAFFDADPILLPRNDGGTYVAWPKSIDNGDSRIHVQRITSGGQKAWTNDLMLEEPGYDYTWPQIVSDGDDGFLLTWYREWGPYWAPNRDILAQRFDESGNPQWPFNAVLFTGGYIPVYIHQLAAGDGAGGVWVCWYNEQIANHLSTFVQHAGSGGAVSFPLTGLEATTNMGTLTLEPVICANEANQDAYIFWRESTLNQNQHGIFGQRIDLTGNRLWGNNGLQFVAVGIDNPILLNLSALGSGGVVSYLYEPYLTTTSTVRAIRFDDAGNQVWTTSPVEVSSAVSPKGKLDAGLFFSGQMILAWADGRTGNSDIFAQNLSEDGNLGPLSYEVTVTPDTLFFLTPESFVDGGPFTISNTGSNPVDILYIQPEGAPVGPYVGWYIMPPVAAYPIPLDPGESLTETVFWMVSDGYPGTLVYDTLEIETSAGNFGVIIVTDSIYIILGQESVDASLFGIYPNPFATSLNIKIPPTGSANVAIRVFTPSMQEITTLTDGVVEQGKIRFHWDGTDRNGNQVPAGVYFLGIQTGEGHQTARVIRMP